MNTKFFAVLLMGTALTFSHAAMAEGSMSKDSKGWEDMKNMSPEQRNEMKAKWESMSDADKKQFDAERKAKWEALSTEEKVKMIEQRRDMKRKEMDDQWRSMSDEQKIKYTEEKMKRKHGEHGDKRAPKH